MDCKKKVDWEILVYFNFFGLYFNEFVELMSLFIVGFKSC